MHIILKGVIDVGSLKGLLKATRPLIRVLVINDNTYGQTISWEKMSIGLSMGERAYIESQRWFGDNV